MKLESSPEVSGGKFPLQSWLRTNVMTKSSLKGCIWMFLKILANLRGGHHKRWSGSPSPW